MHQPYYKDLLTGESELPWVRLHGLKDYLDMVRVAQKFPSLRLTMNIVPSLLEQVEDYTRGTLKDKFLELSYKPAATLTRQEQEFILDNFFSINKDTVISLFPRYLELYFKKLKGLEFTTQDYLDLQVWFNLAWTDPLFRQEITELRNAVSKGRFFSEEEKRLALDSQAQILQGIVPAYRQAQESGNIEISVTPYYHPILPLLVNTRTAREANAKTLLPKEAFAYSQDAASQVEEAVKFFREKFGCAPRGMWPSEESVSERILPFIIKSGLSWIVADEGILFKSLKKKKRDTRLLYQPYLLERKDGSLNIVFRDRNLSDLVGFVYHNLTAEAAVTDMLMHLKNIADIFKKEDTLVTLAMDGENAWEYYKNDGHDFLELLYARLCESSFVKTTTVSEHLKNHPPKGKIKKLVPGSWIFSNFDKWMNNPYKTRAWEVLAEARKELEGVKCQVSGVKLDLAWKQMYILEGSDWFWWYGEDPSGSFDRLFRRHLLNFYRLIEKEPPDYLNQPLAPV
jgi:alpha-amylase/alpha-mannosidase (GH57 family)